jgi:hypothetical protein
VETARRRVQLQPLEEVGYPAYHELATRVLEARAVRRASRS